MLYYSQVAGQEHEVTIQGEGRHLRVKSKNGSSDVRIEPGSDGAGYCIWLGQVPHPVSVQGWSGSWVEFLVAGRQVRIQVETEIDRLMLQGEGETGPGTSTLNSVMPGIVTRLLVSEGDEVAQGQPLLLLEAMKMENEVRAESAGRIDALHVSAGDTVDSGAPLLTVVT